MQPAGASAAAAGAALPTDTTLRGLIMCVECEDQPACMRCDVCVDPYCGPCFQHQHRKGSRALHGSQELQQSHEPLAMPSKSPAEGEEGASESKAAESVKRAPIRRDLSTITTEGDMTARCRVVPLRLDEPERALLRLLEAALQVSEYTDNIDVWSMRHKTTRVLNQLNEVLSVLSGLVVSSDFRRGQQLVAARVHRDNAEYFQRVFEVGRRFKIMNPEKMRVSYGKLVYMLQDSVSPDVARELDFSCVAPVRTVHDFLREREGLAMLADEDLAVATQEILGSGRTRAEIDEEVAAKAAATERLVELYSTEALPEPEIRRVLASVADYHSYLASNRTPIDRMLDLLTSNFSPNACTKADSLEIRSGLGGARLSHSHSQQYGYVLQSLTLWREISHDMMLLWCCAEEDLLSRSCMYRLRDTGQGLNRMQPAPAVGRAMGNILRRTMEKVGGWIGSSAVHLGDHNVPNALMFIDKYTQVPRILNPIVNCVIELERLDQTDQRAHDYMQQEFGGFEGAKMAVLRDFFRHGFDGSGADNFFDAGSCIDGRLTSAWNWCSKIEKKSFHSLFLLSGFVGFDGAF